MSEAELALAVQRIAIYGTIAAALVGAVFGFLGNWLSTLLTKQAERKRQLFQLGVEIGMKGYLSAIDVAKVAAKRRNAPAQFIQPPALFVHFNMLNLELLEAGKLTPESYQRLTKERDKMIEGHTGHSSLRKLTHDPMDEQERGTGDSLPGFQTMGRR